MKKYKIVVLDGKGQNPGDLSWNEIKKLGETQIYNDTPYNKIIERAKNADIVVINKSKFDKKIITALPKLKYICEAATGFDNIDLKAANQQNIPVSNVRGYSTTSVVQQVFALIFALTNKAEYYSNQVNNGKWKETNYFTFWDFPIHELAGKTLGLYGFGKIGSKVATIGKAFGMKVIANRYNPNKGYAEGIQHASIDELLCYSDILSLHAPLTVENTELINKSTLSKMKSNSLLINTARGKMINEFELSEALNNDVIAGAGLDVLSSEPPSNDNPLINAKKCIITPHQAWTSVESRIRLMNGVVANIKGFIDGRPVNIVN